LYTMPLLRWTNGRLFYGPFSLTHFVALWNENRCPTRFMDVLLLIGPVWLMANIEGLHFWKDLRWGMKLMTGMALTTVLLAEHYPKEFQFVDLKRGPAVYAALANSQEESAMFVPFGLVDGKHAFGAMWLEPFAFQPVHGRKMNNGFLSRIDAATWDYFENDTFIVRLVRNQSHEKDTPFPNPEYDPCIYTPTDYSETKKAIEKFRLSQIVIRRDLLKDPVTDFLFASLGPFIVSDTTFAEGHRLIGLRPN
jgi:hypothetical protein